jgi:hypothetical protein
MATVGGATVGLGSRVVVGLDVAKQVEHGSGINVAPGQDRREQEADLGQGDGR